MTADIQPRVTLAHDDTGGGGPLLVLLPGAGDLRSEYRFLTAPLVDAGYRVVSADLPGHGDSAPTAQYTVESTSAAILDLIATLDAGPAVVIATSFAPAAAVWAAAERPDLIRGLVSISPHFHGDDSLKGRLQAWAIKAMLRGPWAAGTWARFYAGWYKASPPADLEDELGRLRKMVGDPLRRRAVRETLTADRAGVAERMARAQMPTLTVFGSADDHFADPEAEARAVGDALHGDHLIVDGAGHYPHVEQPEVVAEAVVAFLDRLH